MSFNDAAGSAMLSRHGNPHWHPMEQEDEDLLTCAQEDSYDSGRDAAYMDLHCNVRDPYPFISSGLDDLDNGNCICRSGKRKSSTSDFIDLLLGRCGNCDSISYATSNSDSSRGEYDLGWSLSEQDFHSVMPLEQDHFHQFQNENKTENSWKNFHGADFSVKAATMRHVPDCVSPLHNQEYNKSHPCVDFVERAATKLRKSGILDIFSEDNTPVDGMLSKSDPSLHDIPRQVDLLVPQISRAHTDITYMELIAKALLTAPNYKMMLGGIYKWIIDNFPHVIQSKPSWQNSVRHNLSTNLCFVKGERGQNSRGFYWHIHDSCLANFRLGDFDRRRARQCVMEAKRKNARSEIMNIQRMLNSGGANVACTSVPANKNVCSLGTLPADRTHGRFYTQMHSTTVSSSFLDINHNVTC